jgi:sulfite reductase (NADPH) hemoprotein beta-component
MSDVKLAANEYIKADSNLLRGTIEEGLENHITGALYVDDTQLSKFHGFYQQDDRDLRTERKAQKLEPLHSFMLRARVPGGVCTPAQWIDIDAIASKLTTNGSIRLTTRQTFQYHGILKRNLKPLIQALDLSSLDSIAACGDVNRNVMCNPNPVESELHQETYEWSKQLSEQLLPRTNAYAEIWLDGEKVTGLEEEPMYGKTYLPRKFKIAVAVPPHNDVDVYTNCLGFIAISENGKLIGFNVTVGGGMGATHGDKETYPRLADNLGFIKLEDTIEVAKAVITTQRDWGNRVDRKLARIKYTVQKHGIDKFRDEVAKRSGVTIETPREIKFTTRGDRFGWVKGTDNKWHLTLYIECGRIKDVPGKEVQTCFREIAKVHKGDFRMTSNQNMIVANVSEQDKATIEGIARKYGVLGERLTPLREHSIACVSLPTCALGMAEAERYFPEFTDKVDLLLSKHGIGDQPIVMRMTGCPNGCARPYAAEIGLVGKGPGRYNLYLGAAFDGTRISKMVRENINESEILAELDGRFERFAASRQAGENFGDFLVRTNEVKAVLSSARDFHEYLAEDI